MNVILLTKNKFKAEEIKKIINGFGIKLRIFENIDPLDLEQDNNEVFVLREETYLEKDGKKIKNPSHLDSLKHVSTLKVTKYFEGKKETQEYKSEVKGFIDETRKQPDCNDIYNWDDIFVCLKNLQSYYEMRNTAGKFSARTKVIAKFLNDYTFFDKKVDLKFNPFNQENVVEFNDKIYDLIDNNQYIKYYKNNPLLNGLMTNILNNGLFTRSSMNKKQRNYWYPALNAGLPLVPKKDELHEITFMFHDLMHHAIPDLIMTGEDSKNHKETYVIHRMLSEAFTLVLADMVFIDELVKNDIEYDWSKRKIYPLYESMNIKKLTKEKLKEILWANVNFALLGEEKLMLSLTNEEVFYPFKEKYEKFFIEDYRWTSSNYDNMMKSKDTIKKWFNSNKELINENNTINHFENLTVNKNNYKEKVKVIFNEVWLRLEKYMDNPKKVDINNSIQKAFKNYMVGQSILFFRYDYLKESEIFFNLIKKELIKNNTQDIKRMRELFNLYIDKLTMENKLNENTALIYKEVVPLFEAFYVFYDKELKYNSIKNYLNKNML
tara:strand:- start:11068 stop:12717 length:1650 start_codon:yes stop_codon:yes gene_type:complete